MPNFQINPQANMITATVDFHGSSHAIAYGIGILVGGSYSFNVHGDNKDVNDDIFYLPTPLTNLIGRSLIFQVAVSRLTPDKTWSATLTLSDDKGLTQPCTLENKQFQADKDAQMTIIDFI